MRHYWHNLQAREQRTLLLGGVVTLLLLLYGTVLDPFAQEMQRLEQRVAEDRELLAWMEQAAVQVKQLRGSGAARRADGQSLLSLLDASAKQSGLGAALKQVKPEGVGVRLRFETAGFDALVGWLGRLAAEQGVGVTTLTLERLAQPGRVNATVVLEGGQ
ncbi:MAG: type II secretion system protein M [Gammaproteobacteria bacterium]|nr:type II secretion system protein M [Gammaproteobacteria bacterium]